MQKHFAFTIALILLYTFTSAQLTINLGPDRETCGFTTLGMNSVSGGTPPYQYQWTSIPPGFTSNQLSIGLYDSVSKTYILSVTDNLGAHASDTATITHHKQLICDFPSYDTNTCLNNITRFECNTSGGVPPYTYQWSFDDGTLTNDTAQNTLHVYNHTGTFEAQVLVRDAAVCAVLYVGRDVHVLQDCGIFHLSKQDMQCYNTCNGNAGITAQPAGNYRYIWSTGDTTASINNLCQGIYYVTILDAQLNPIDTMGTIINRPYSFYLQTYSDDVNCFGGHDGYIAVGTPSTGVPPFTYLWTNGTTSRFNTQLYPGIYTVTVSDAAGCSETATDTVIEPSSALVPNVTATGESSPGLCDGTATTTVSGGVPPYTYNWGGGILTANRTGLCPGTYTVTVRDAFGCAVAGSAVVTCGNNNLAFTIQATDIDCQHLTDTIDVNITNGTPPYSYLWSNGDTSTTLITSQPGIYTLWLTDSSGCTKAATDTIHNNGINVLQLTTPVSCTGTSNGKIKVTVTGGTAPYSYLWSNGAVTDSVTGLAPGTYLLTVTDAMQCSQTFTYQVGQVITNWSYYVYASSTAANCTDNGSAIAQVNGGVAPYTYAWNTTPPQTTLTATGLQAGHYTVTVTGANGCTTTGTTQVPTSCDNIITGYVFNDENSNCLKDTNEAVIPNIFISADNGNHNYFGNSSGNGQYTLYIGQTGNFNVSGSYNNGWGSCAANATCGAQTTGFATYGDTAFINIPLSANSGFNLNIHPGWSPANPGFTKHYWVLYNQTSLPLYTGPAGIVFTYDSILVYQSCTNGGVHNATNHTITWSVNSVPYPSWNWYTKPEAFFTVPANTPLNYPLRQDFRLTPTTGDCDTLNNRVVSIQPVSGSMDPNAKEVLPAGDITGSDSVLTYTIHFQNTGNDTTWFITVEDTLSPYLDALTVQNVSSSHPYSSFSISGTGILTWVFNPIFLADSTTSEADSKGFITFKVKRKNDLPATTVVSNTAHIYFDYNTPIVTNTVSNTVATPTHVFTIKNDADITARAMPNPFTQQTKIIVDGTNSAFNFELFDATGKVVRKTYVAGGNSFELQRADLTAGVYFFRITTLNKQGAFGRLMVE